MATLVPMILITNQSPGQPMEQMQVRFFYHCGEKFSITNVCGLLRVKNNEIVTKFLFYVLRMTAQSYVYAGMGNPKLMSNVMSNVCIPLPPLPIQEEIVRILDRFTELETELETELDLRKKQYEYYRSTLLGMEDNDKTASFKRVPLEDVAYYSSKRINASEIDSENYIGVDNLLPNKRGRVSSNYVPTEGTLIEYLPNDILIGNIRPYLKKIWFATNNGGTNGDVLAIRVKTEVSSLLLPLYLFHVLSTDIFFNFDVQNSRGAKMPRGNKKLVMKYPIPLPPLAEQARIVAILDRFDRLTNDISVGLPAEIAARHKQYEYYRDTLLSFDEK